MDKFRGDACATSAELDAYLSDLFEYRQANRHERQTQGTIPVIEMGGLVVLEDNGEFTSDNDGSVWDLEDSSLHFEPTPGADGFFDVTRTPVVFDVDLGTQAAAWQDEWGQLEYALPFVLPFGTATYDTLYILSDIGIFFESQQQPGSSSQYGQSQINLSTPRIAPLLRRGPWVWADIMHLYIKEEPDAVTITWHEQTSRPDSNHDLDRLFQVKISSDGNISFAYPQAYAFNTFGYVQVVAPGPDGSPDWTDLSTLSQTPTTVRRAYQAFTFPTLIPQAVDSTLSSVYGFDETNLDGLMIYQNFYTEITFYAGAYHTQGNPGVSGIGRPVSLATSLMHMNYIDLSWNLRDDGSMVSVLSHEFGHRWLYFVSGVGESRSGAHPAQNAHMPAPFNWWTEIDSSPMGGTTWSSNGDGTFTTPPMRTYYAYAWVELYLMGLAAPLEVQPWWYVGDNPDLNGPYYPPIDSTFEGTLVDLQIEDVIDANGQRIPAYPDTQRDFRAADVLLTRPQNALQAEHLVNVRHKMNIWRDAWSISVGQRGSVETELDEILATSVPDCNFNGVADDEDVATGTSTDDNANGIPDECECPADINGDGVVGPIDLATLLGAWGANPESPADLNGDGVIDPIDLATLLGAWGPCE